MHSTGPAGQEWADLTAAHRVEEGTGFWCFISCLKEQVAALSLSGSVVCVGEQVQCM